jgi:hypothetical protein
MSMRFRPIVLAAIAATVVAAFGADISGPLTGYVFDSTSRIVRPVLGIPGAATLGDGLNLGFDVTMAAIAPKQDYLLAVDTDGQVWLVRLGAGTADRLDTLHGTPERINFSPNGSAALLIQGGTADVFTGLPGSPALARTVALNGIPTSSDFAVSDDGSAVLAAASDAVSVAGSSAEWRSLSGAGADARVAFSPGSHDAAAASRATNTVTLFHNPADGGDSVTLAGPDDGIDNAAGVAFTTDGRVLVASGSGNIAILDANGSSRATVSCGCTPTGLAPMGGLFRLTDRTDAPLWMVDARSGDARVFFVPALRADTATLTGAQQQ